MDWVLAFEHIAAIVGTLIGLVGGGVGIYFWKVNKSLKQEEVNSAKIENELKQADAWQKLYEEERNANKALYEERDTLKEKLGKAEFKVCQLEWFHCTVNGCHRRRPPHIFDKDIDGNETEEMANRSTECSGMCKKQ